jgi:maltooligosyltrehalose trehalohydrolase
VKTDIKDSLNGVTLLGDGQAEFRVWAPAARRVRLQLMRRTPTLSLPERSEKDGARQSDQSEEIEMRALGSADFGMPDLEDTSGNLFSVVTKASAGDRYFYVVDNEKPVPDPVSRYQPEGVHGPSEIIDPESFRWSDSEWRGLELSQYVIYELHVGTFTPEGTFDAAIAKLPYLKSLGVTVVEVMPVNAFPGNHNWGYDGVGLYAVQASYGGPEAFKRFVDAAHVEGLAVMLDVVYNHLGNEGNYLRIFGPYFTSKHQTPWGEAVNYDDEGCEGVRRFVVDNAKFWVREYHVDGLRLDAVQTIKDDSELHIVAEIEREVKALAQELGRRVCVIAETDENDSRYVLPPEKGGDGLDAVWSDDFHHAVHALLTGERAGYYQDFGAKEQIVKALNEGYVFQGEPFKFWNDARGTSAAGVPLPANVICIQNHDQVGNRAKGERLTELVPKGARKIAAALLLLAPHTPLLFMGQEFDETAPFQFFADFKDPNLQKAVSEGRRREFKDFSWEEVPDPQARETFERSRLDWHKVTDENDMLRWYRDLLRLRHEIVMRNERTCAANLVVGGIVMQVPRGDPKLMVCASLEADCREWPVPEGWEQVMKAEDDGYCVAVMRGK